MTVKQRLTEFAKTQEKSVRAFEIKTGLTIGYINSIRVSIQPDKLQSIASHYPELNTGWLMTGEGSMLKATTAEVALLASEKVPVYELRESGSLQSLFENKARPVDYVLVPGISKSDGAVYVWSDRMYPDLKRGDVALYKQVRSSDLRRHIFLDKTYLVGFSLDGEEYVMMNCLDHSDDGESLILISRNDKYPPMDIPVNSVNALAVIQASVRYA